MATELTKTEQQALQLKERSIGLINTLTTKEDAERFARTLTIDKIISQAMPISILRQNVEPREIKRALDAELTRFIASLNLKWTISDHQVSGIVEDLLTKYPNETLEDFVLVFRKARTGEFKDEHGNATIYRLDSAVIFDWMNKYLDEKYEALERDLMRQKDNHNFDPRRSDSDWLKLWQESLEIGTEPKTQSQSVVFRNSLSAMTEKEIKEEGQEKPKALEYPSTPIELHKESEMKRQYARECTDIYTGRLKPGMPSFEDWLKDKL